MGDYGDYSLSECRQLQCDLWASRHLYVYEPSTTSIHHDDRSMGLTLDLHGRTVSRRSSRACGYLVSSTVVADVRIRGGTVTPEQARLPATDRIPG
jgi:hypothetical protein